MVQVMVPENPVPVNCCVLPRGTVAEAGVTDARLGVGVGVGAGVLLPPPPQPMIAKNAAPANKTPVIFAIPYAPLFL
jgi:hypothetical protein